MEETAPQVDLAIDLLEVIPELLRSLRADVPTGTDADHAASEWQDIVELRTTTGQVRLLRTLVKHERCTMQELAAQLVVTPPTATAMVKRLLAQGYIERLRDEEDWRVVWVHATERGKRAIALYDQLRRSSLQQRLAHLSAEERACLQAALPALHHLVEVKS